MVLSMWLHYMEPPVSDNIKTCLWNWSTFYNFFEMAYTQFSIFFQLIVENKQSRIDFQLINFQGFCSWIKAFLSLDITSMFFIISFFLIFVCVRVRFDANELNFQWHQNILVNVVSRTQQKVFNQNMLLKPKYDQSQTTRPNQKLNKEY